jgi:hypothetical protein
MNIYWSVFKNLENEFTKLMYNIHIDDYQLTVYSSKICDLILRSVIEIESISKELYYVNGGTKTGEIRYDDVAIKHLNSKLLLDKKVVLISSINCFQTQKELYPFVKNELRTGKATHTFSWNNSYQNIKHDRVKSLKFGSLKYLFDAMSALYLLNIYYADRIFNLEKDYNAFSLSPNLGSDIFSVLFSPCKGYGGNGDYIKANDFEKSVYFVAYTKETADILFDSQAKFIEKINELASQNPKTIEYLNNVDNNNLEKNWLYIALGENEYLNIFRQAQSLAPIAVEQLRYEAVLNKNQL